MVQSFDRKNLAVSEKILEIAESLQQVPKYFFIILAMTVVLMVPGVVVLRAVFFNLLFASYTPPPIVYTAPQPKALEVADKKIFPAGQDSFYAYARVANANADLGVRTLKYKFTISDNSGAELGSYEGVSFVLPGQERLLFMPAQKVSRQPVAVAVALSPERWSKIGDIRTLNFTYEQSQFGKDTSGHFYASAVMRNDNPYIIPEVEMGIILYNSKREVVGANSTVLNQILLDENRFFRVLWPQGVAYNDVANVEYKATVNQLRKGSLLTDKIVPDNYYDYIR